MIQLDQALEPHSFLFPCVSYSLPFGIIIRYRSTVSFEKMRRFSNYEFFKDHKIISYQ